jgi:hypothetical protein
MKYQYLFLVLALVLFSSFTSASLGTFKQYDCVNIKTILNTSAVTLSTLNYPNNSLIVSGQPMTALGKTFNYTTCATSALGTYTYDYNDTQGNVYVNDFMITPNGQLMDISGSILLFIIAGILLVATVLSYFRLHVENIKREVNQKPSTKTWLYVLIYYSIFFFFYTMQYYFTNYLYNIPVMGMLSTLVFQILLWGQIIFLLFLVFHTLASVDTMNKIKRLASMEGNEKSED